MPKPRRTQNQTEYEHQLNRLKRALREVAKEGYNVPAIELLIGEKPKHITKKYLSKLKQITRNVIRAKSTFEGDISPQERRKLERKRKRKLDKLIREEEERRQRLEEEERQRREEEERRKQEEEEREAMGWTVINSLLSDLEANATNRGLQKVCEKLEEVIANLIANFGVYEVYVALKELGFDRASDLYDFVLSFPSDQGVYIVEYRIERFIGQAFGKYMNGDDKKEKEEKIKEYETNKKDRKETSNKEFIDYSAEDWVVPEDNVEDFPW